MNSEKIVRQQVHWAAHMGIQSIVFSATGMPFNLARIMKESLAVAMYATIHLRVVWNDEGWTAWNAVRMMCHHDPKLSVVLQLTHDVPSVQSLLRWKAEPVSLLLIPTDIFITNTSGFPVLGKTHQKFIQDHLKTNCKLVVVSGSQDSHSLAAYREYLEFLNVSMPSESHVERLSSSYRDYLQMPLQPLMDNLDSSTYQVFESDPVKYEAYERAVCQALLDLHPPASSQSKPVVIMVVGAGRGPLVARCLRAARTADRRVKLYAVEKNSNAIVGLRQRKLTEWLTDPVTIVHTDMRFWNAPEKADILVSELLGSFGDNELSPECLDGAQHLLDLSSPNSISIPSSYTSYISPLSSAKLFKEASAFNDTEHMETPYVVKFHSVYSIQKPQPLWTFHHPVKHSISPLGHPHFNQHNTRYSQATFDVDSDAVMHGVAAYFDAVLYKDVTLSIHPDTHSASMFSWFPMYFPIKTPIFLPKGSQVTICFWRLTDARKVWYEWSVVGSESSNHQTLMFGETCMIHNSGGKRSWIGL